MCVNRREMMMERMSRSTYKLIKQMIFLKMKEVVEYGVNNGDEIHTIVGACVCESRYITSKYMGYPSGVRPSITVDRSKMTMGAKDYLNRYVAMRVCHGM